MDTRHTIVHPFSAEFLGTEQATIQAPYRAFPNASAEAARAAVANVDRFFELLRMLDEPHSRFFVLF